MGEYPIAKQARHGNMADGFNTQCCYSMEILDDQDNLEMQRLYATPNLACHKTLAELMSSEVAT
jgi:hypothetical protein